ncbi:hypothetical protein BV898_16316 [Hypsibius exemplaris]|uniref:Uncharacterized protein n=1 Tax=Hypsibius exemplaris TaxID=2072580 RepID=A0A9X6NEL0_HYPEX|nr:hypothetical protein BV898_16316 [Hypsibius exemplaris]
MPAHEFVIITKLCAAQMPKPQVPHKKLAHDQFHWRGLHWILKADIPVVALSDLQDEWKRDIDLISQFCDSLKTEETFYPKQECMLEEESLPPAYRKDVYDLMTKGKIPIKSRKI